MNEIACSTYAFLGTPLPEALKLIGDLGFDCAELVLHDSPDWGHVRPAEIRDDPEEAAAAVRQAVDSSGTRMIAATLSMDEDIGWQRGEFEAACRFMRAARIHTVTLPAGRDDKRAEAFRLKDYRDIAAKFGVVLSVEAQSMMNWGNSLFILPWEASGFARNEPGHRMTLDTGHMLHAGVRQEDWSRILDITAHVHIRDAKAGPGFSQVPFGEGDLKLGEMVRAMRKANYQGSFTVEYVKGWAEGVPLDAERESERLREALETELEKSEGG